VKELQIEIGKLKDNESNTNNRLETRTRLVNKGKFKLRKAKETSKRKGMKLIILNAERWSDKILFNCGLPF